MLERTVRFLTTVDVVLEEYNKAKKMKKIIRGEGKGEGEATNYEIPS